MTNTQTTEQPAKFHRNDLGCNMFSITAHDGFARCGKLLTRHAAIITPTPMLYTRRGGSMYLTPDMMAKLRPSAQLLQVNVLQFLEQPNADLLQKFGRGLHQYIGVPEWPMLASNRDASLTEYVTSRPANNDAAYVHIHCGARTVTPERYMQTVFAMHPDVFVTLADEVLADASKKRVAASVDRTAKWLDTCLDLHQHWRQQQQQDMKQQQQQQQEGEGGGKTAVNSSSSSSGRGPATGAPQPDMGVFVPVVGGVSTAERERSAKDAAGRAGVDGFALCGFGLGESPEQQVAALEAAMTHLPPDKPKLAVGLGSVEQVVDAVGRGVDLFDCSLPLAVSAGGYAFCFPRSPGEGPAQKTAAAADGSVGSGASGSSSGREGAVGSTPEAEVGADATKLNLWSTQYRLDAGPLVAGCTCFCCTHHTRAYLHHLLHTHEMLAGVLLEMHNTHWWLGFFDAMQSAIQQGQWQAYQHWALQRQTTGSPAAAEGTS